MTRGLARSSWPSPRGVTHEHSTRDVRHRRRKPRRRHRRPPTLRERGFDGRVVLMPEQTLRAFADHGDPTRALDIDLSEAERVLAQSAEAGIDLDEIAKAWVPSWLHTTSCSTASLRSIPTTWSPSPPSARRCRRSCGPARNRLKRALPPSASRGSHAPGSNRGPRCPDGDPRPRRPRPRG